MILFRLFNRLQSILFSIFLLIWTSITFTIVLPKWCHLHPKWCNPHFANFYDVPKPSEIFLDQENQYRLEMALKSLSKYGSDPTRNQNLSNLTLAIIAKKRPYPIVDGRSISVRYLTQVTSRLLEIVNNRSWLNRTNLFICNTDERPERFDEALELSRYVRMVTKNNETDQKSTTANDDRFVPEIDNIFEREKYDYVFCLKQALKRTTENGYVIIFQDDAWPIDDFELMLKSVLDQLRVRRLRYFDRDRSSSIFIKFYHPERYRKIPWFIFVGAYSMTITLSIAAIIYRFSNDHSSNRFRRILFFVWIFIYSIFFFWCLGHTSVASIRYFLSGRSIYLVRQESCCIPCVLFTRQSASIIVDYLLERRAYSGYAVDHMMDEMPSVFGLMTDMNMVRHIGRYTTLRGHPVNADPW